MGLSGIGFIMWKIFLLFVVGAFLIPNCFISRHVTTGVLGISVLAAVYAVNWVWQNKVIKTAPLLLFVLLFSVFWLFYQFSYSALAWHDQIEYVSFVLLLLVFSQQNLNDMYLKQYYFVCSIAGASMASWGILQYFGFARVYYNLVPVTGSFENPTGIAIFLSILLPASLFFAREREWSCKIWGYFASLFTIIVVVLSGSRTGILTILVICIFFFYRYIFFSRRVDVIKRYLLLGVVLWLILLVWLYYWKKNSADGRILIWSCSLDMFQDHWFLGIGSGKFQAKYMLYQAEYFRQNPDSMFKMLADNVRHPFNEYLKILVEYGVLGFTFLVGLFFHVLELYKSNKENFYLFPVFGSILAIGLSACFSYPMNYPSVGIILIMNIAILSLLGIRKKEISKKVPVIVGKSVVLFCMPCLLWITICMGYSEFEWNRIAKTSLAGKTKEMLPRYEKIYTWMKDNGMFLYNYGAELCQVGKYDESLRVLGRCSLYFNDINLQLLLAEDHLRLKKFSEAERNLQLASYMCPVRFVPLYKLMNMYLEMGEIEKANDYAKKIIDKPIKIYSISVEGIKERARELLD